MILTRTKQRLRQIFRSPLTHVDVLTGYAHWAAHYPAEAHNPLMQIEQQAMLALLPDVLDKTCLDLACGSGRYLRLLRVRGSERTVGLDYSAEMLKQAESPAGDHQSSFVRSPFLHLPFSAKMFDVIVCGLGVGHEKNLTGILAEVARILRPGGYFLYSDFHPFGALAGWQRSFTSNGVRFALEHYIHLYSDHVRACRAAGLTIDAVLEPAADHHSPAGFEQTPVVLVIRALKKGS